MKAAVIGAGYMGSAITFPLVQAGIKVNLWGTWLDDEIVSAARKGNHPKLKKPLPDPVSIYYSEDLQQAVEGCQLIFMAVTSQGFMPVFNRLRECRGWLQAAIFCLTKGLVEAGGQVTRISEAVSQKTGEAIKWVSIGGPVKAVELAYFTPTLSIYGTRVEGLTEIIKKIRVPYYITETTTDVCGVEICSAFKNVYAMGLGICDGLYADEKPGAYHNLSSLIFAQGIKEMTLIVEAGGGKDYTAYGPAGVGDLYVTSQSGRNRRFGELIGKGVQPGKAYKDMLQIGEVAEGYHALKLGIDYVKGLGIKDRLPLLSSLYDIAYRSEHPQKGLEHFTEKL